MSYSPVTDFLALLRQTGGSVELARMPGLDYIISAMARAGLVTLWTGQTAPTVNQTTTVWLRPASPSWTAEGVVFLYDGSIGGFSPATPTLWSQLIAAPPTYVFQAASAANNVVNDSTTLLAVRRTVAVPGTTALTLPALSSRVMGRELRVADWSVVAAEHAITIVTPDGATIMRRPLWTLYSTPEQLSGVTLHPSSDLNGWVIAP